jgi:hypothetical protein
VAGPMTGSAKSEEQCAALKLAKNYDSDLPSKAGQRLNAIT